MPSYMGYKTVRRNSAYTCINFETRSLCYSVYSPSPRLIATKAVSKAALGQNCQNLVLHLFVATLIPSTRMQRFTSKWVFGNKWDENYRQFPRKLPPKSNSRATASLRPLTGVWRFPRQSFENYCFTLLGICIPRK